MDDIHLVFQLVDKVAELKAERAVDRSRLRSLAKRVKALQAAVDDLSNAPSQEPEFSEEVMRAYHAATRDLTPQTKRIVLGKLRTLKADGLNDTQLMASLATGEDAAMLPDL